MEEINPKLLVQHINISANDLRIKVPFAMSIAGPAQAGKSMFILNVIKYCEQVFSSGFERIIYCQPEHLVFNNMPFVEKLKKEFPKLEVCVGIPNISILHLDSNVLPCLLLIDDLMCDLLNSEGMLELLITKVHHFNISACFTMQNYYTESKFGKTHIKNCPYRVFFYNRVEQRELSNISSQIANSASFFLSNFQFLIKNFPNEPSHYLLIDGHFRSPLSQMWCRSNIFPTSENKEIQPIFFFPNPRNKVKRF